MFGSWAGRFGFDELSAAPEWKVPDLILAPNPRLLLAPQGSRRVTDSAKRRGPKPHWVDIKPPVHVQYRSSRHSADRRGCPRPLARRLADHTSTSGLTGDGPTRSAPDRTWPTPRMRFAQAQPTCSIRARPDHSVQLPNLGTQPATLQERPYLSLDSGWTQR
jgi:hypothetical protein